MVANVSLAWNFELINVNLTSTVKLQLQIADKVHAEILTSYPRDIHFGAFNNADGCNYFLIVCFYIMK